MASDHPAIDPRGPAELIADTEALVEQRLGEQNIPWRPASKRPDDRLDALDALIRVFSRMAVHAVQALNRAPESNFLAFLALSGSQPRPPLAARAPLTFTLAEGTTAGAAVPARTRVAAEDDDNVVFETTAPLHVAAVPLRAVYARDPGADRYADLGALTDPETAGPRTLFVGDRPLPHALHVGGGPLFGLPGLKEITAVLDFGGLPAAAIAALPLRWSVHDGEVWRPLAPQISTAPEGDLIRYRAVLTGMPALPLVEVSARSDRWVRAELASGDLVRWWKDHIVKGQGDMIPVADILATLPQVRRLRLAVKAGLELPAPVRAAFGPADLDLTKDLLPFGQEPKFGDTFYVDPCAPDGLPAGATLALAFTACATPPVAPRPSDKLTLAWEVHTAAGWKPVGKSTGAGATSEPNAAFTDTSKALSVSGGLSFKLPGAPVPAPGEADGAWVRARITAGDYGAAARVEIQQGTTVLIPASFAPPIVSKTTVTVAIELLAQTPTSCLALDDFAARDRLPAVVQGQAFPLFTRSADTNPAVYLGFDGSIGQVPLTLFVQTCPLAPEDAGKPGPDDPPRLAWEYRGPAGWRSVTVDDETDSFAAPGLVRLVVPPDHGVAAEFGDDLFWLRVRHLRGTFRGPPRAELLVPNTVWGRHAVTLTGEILGSGVGSGAQSFPSAQRPILAAEQVDVRERTGLSVEEAREFAAPLGDAAALEDEGPFGFGVWVRWTPVQDFRGSGPEDRHYVIDRAGGAVAFGDGVRGRALPQGRGNVRMSYKTGGGAAGNLRAGALTKLKTNLTSIAAVANHIPAAGGADAESTAEFVARSPTVMRHRNRAVAAADFEDLAREASPEVARALAIAPRCDPIATSVDLSDMGDQTGPTGQRIRLSEVPAFTASASERAGRVRLIVVARGSVARPAPSAGLLDQLTGYLRERAASGLRLDVTGPKWVEVRVTARLVAVSHDRAIGLVDAARAACDRFLHPLTGGLDGRGWPFGRVPRRSDINRILAAVPGVDHIRGLTVACDPPPPALDDALSDDELDDLASLMVFAGPHDIALAGVLGEVPL